MVRFAMRPMPRPGIEAMMKGGSRGSFSEREAWVVFEGCVKVGRKAISFAMWGFVRIVMPRPAKKDSEVKTQNSSSSVVRVHVGVIVQGSLAGSKEGDEVLWWKTSWLWSCLHVSE